MSEEPGKTYTGGKSFFRRLIRSANGLEVANPLGQEKCIHYQLRLIQLFCEKVGLRISNWDEIMK
jgi:hypothetical protein